MNASMEQLRRADGALCYRAAEGKEWTDTTGHGPARQREAGGSCGSRPAAAGSGVSDGRSGGVGC